MKGWGACPLDSKVASEDPQCTRSTLIKGTAPSQCRRSTSIRACFASAVPSFALNPGALRLVSTPFPRRSPGLPVRSALVPAQSVPGTVRSAHVPPSTDCAADPRPLRARVHSAECGSSCRASPRSRAACEHSGAVVRAEQADCGPAVPAFPSDQTVLRTRRTVVPPRSGAPTERGAVLPRTPAHPTPRSTPVPRNPRNPTRRSSLVPPESTQPDRTRHAGSPDCA